MEKDKVIEIASDVKNHSNSSLIDARNFLIDEFEKTKKLIIELTRHMEGVEDLYNEVNNEIGKRIK
jgi:hypothetical protein